MQSEHGNAPIPIIYVNDASGLAQVCSALACATEACIDTEFHREHTYFPVFALLQIACNGRCFIIDPLAIEDLSPLWHALQRRELLKILHASRQDLEVIHHASGTVLEPIFDTQLAAAFLGLGDQISLAGLVKNILHVRMPKSQSISDWLNRPLSREQIAYAADDVRYLKPLYDHLHRELAHLGRLAWLYEEQRSLVESRFYVNDPENAYLRLKGTSKLRAHQLAVLRELALWRETTAMKLNQPKKRIASDEALVELSRKSQLNRNDLAHLRCTGTSCLRKHADEVLKAWRKGRDCPPCRWPKPEHPVHSAKGVELPRDMLATLVRIRAEECRIAPGLLANRNELKLLAHWAIQGGHPPKLRCLSGWRKKLVGDDLLRLLEGKICLCVDAKTKKPTLRRAP